MLRWLLFVLLFLLEVTIVLSQDAPANPDYFAEAEVDNSAPYLGQQIRYRFRFYDAVGVSNPSYIAPDFEGFWRINTELQSQFVHQIGDRQYTVFELVTALYPTRVGDLVITSATVVIPETVYRSQDEIVVAPLTVQVQPLPDSAPVEFSGGVGQFDLSATLERQTADLGEPITLLLTVRGTGNVEQLSLSESPLPEDWRVYESQTTFQSSWLNGTVIGEKTYEYLLSPIQTGSQLLPSITLSYFDPENGLYRSAATEPITLEILPPSIPTVSPSAEINASHADGLTLKPISLDVPESNIFPVGIIWLFWLIPPLGVAALWGWIRYQQWHRHSQIHSEAYFQARHQLHDALKAPVPDGFRLVRKAIMGYLQNRMSLQPGQSETDPIRLMNEARIPQSLRQVVLACLEKADEGRYAPDATLDQKMLIQQAGKILLELDKVWK